LEKGGDVNDSVSEFDSHDFIRESHYRYPVIGNEK